MKKLCKFVGVLASIASLFIFGCSSGDDGDTIYAPTTYATTEIGAVDVTAKAYPGVNILTWKAVKDAASYSVYKTTGDGNIEENVSNFSTNTYYTDTAIAKNTSYKYRIVANPKDATVHDASQREVSLKTAADVIDSNLKGTWAPASTSFLSLAQYENDYNQNEEVLSANTISAVLAGRSGSNVRVTFPVKPYAKYIVTLAQKGGSALNSSSTRDSQAAVYGYNFNGTATVDLAAIYTGEKEVTIKAVPLNSALYNSSTVVASSTVEVTDYAEIANAVADNKVYAEWTNYNRLTNVATARVYFTPYTFNGSEFATSEYTVYRAVYGSDGETKKIDDSTATRVYSSITSLGNPKKDTSVTASDKTVYYVDDSLSISASSDVSAVRYYVVLNHDDKYKSNSKTLIVPAVSDDNWNFTPDSTYETENYVTLNDIYVDSDGKINVVLGETAYNSTLSFTYGAFDTYNEAETAVESELPTSISVSRYFAGNSADSVTTGKYYAFRLVSKTGDADDVVKTVIAVPFKEESYYYLDVKSGKDNISNYVASYSFFVSNSKEVTSSNFSSITLNWSNYSYNGVNVYRAISSSDLTYPSYSLLGSTTSSSYTDSSAVLKATSLNSYVYYKIVAVGYYGKATQTVNISALSAPVVTLSGSTLYWDSVSNATEYCIYKATSESYLLNQSNFSNRYSSTSTYYTPDASYSSDYYYAVKAYNSSNYEYSGFSNVVKIEKSEVPAVSNLTANLYSYSGSSYTWRILWNTPSNYSGTYYISTYQTDSDLTEDEAKAQLTTNSSNYSSYNNYYNLSASSNYKYTWVAVKTRVYDSDSGYIYSDVNEVVKVSNSFDSTLTFSRTYDSSTSSYVYNLSWSAIDGAVSYAVYNVNKSSITLYASDIGPNNRVVTTTETTASVTSSSSSAYSFFVVYGLDSNNEIVGQTNVVRY